MRKVFITLVLGFLVAASAYSQGVAVRYIMGETHRVYKHPTFDNYCMGFGVDRTFNERFTAGLDITYDIIYLLKLEDDHYQYANIAAGTYDVKPKLLSLNYHTEYALGDNEGTHVYIGTFIGLRHLSQKWRLEDYNYYYGSPSSGPYPTTKEISMWLVPVGLRMGLRGATDGGFLDLYTAVGYQIGGGKQVADGAQYRPTPKTRYLETSSLAVSIGVAWGIGW